MSADQTAGRPLPAEESRGNILYGGQLFRNHDKLLSRITRLSISLPGWLGFGVSQVEPIDAGPFFSACACRSDLCPLPDPPEHP
jgi:hypothetical protein